MTPSFSNKKALILYRMERAHETLDDARALFEQKAETENRKKELVGKMDKAEERFIEGDIDRDGYHRYKAKIEEQLAEIAREELKLSIPLSNQGKFIHFSVLLLHELYGLYSPEKRRYLCRYQWRNI